MARSIMEVLAEIDGGKLLEKLTNEYARISAGVTETGLKGKLVLTLDFKQNKGTQLFIKSGVKAVVPEEGIAEAAFFCAEDGSLTRRDPKQQELFANLKTVSNL